MYIYKYIKLYSYIHIYMLLVPFRRNN